MQRTFSFEPYPAVVLSEFQKQDFEDEVDEMIMRHVGYLWGVYGSRLKVHWKNVIMMLKELYTDGEWANVIKHFDSYDFQIIVKEYMLLVYLVIMF